MYDQERIFLKQKVTGMNLLDVKNGGCLLEMQRINSVFLFSWPDNLWNPKEI
jgi:hypothetical protein